MQIQKHGYHSNGGMRRPCAFERGDTTENEYIKFMRYLKGKSTLLIYNRHPELQSK